MNKVDAVDTYKQFLAAEQLARVLLTKYAQEASRGPLVLHGDIQVEEALETVAERLGYRVYKSLPEIVSLHSISPQAAE